MATIATTSHQKEINVKISLFLHHCNLKVCFQVHFRFVCLSLPEKLISTEIYKSLI